MTDRANLETKPCNWLYDGYRNNAGLLNQPKTSPRRQVGTKALTSSLTPRGDWPTSRVRRQLRRGTDQLPRW